MIFNFIKNMNIAFAGFALAGLISAILIKLILSSSDSSFYPTLVTFVILLMIFHRLSFTSIVENKYKDLGNGKRMTDGAVVDAVYYLGFTFTLLILVTTFISIGQDPGSLQLKYDSKLHGLMDILNRFCVGLFTTGYGLVARIHLSNYVEIEELDPEGLKERLNIKTAALIGVIDNGISSLSTLIETSNQRVVESVTESTNSLTNQANHLASNLAELSENLSKVLTKVKRQVTNLDLTDATAAVEAHLSSTAQGVANLNQSIEDVSNKFGGAGEVVEGSSRQLAEVLSQINAQHANLLSNLNLLSSSITAVAGSSKEFDGAVKDSSISSANFGSQLQQCINVITTLGQTIGQAQANLNVFSGEVSKAQTGLQTNSEMMSRTLESDAQTIDRSIRSLSEKLESLSSTLTSVQKSISSRF